MRKELRPYQKEAVDIAIERMTASPDPVLLELSVGAGKTIVFSFLCEWAESLGKNVLCISSFAELIKQNSDEHTEQGNRNSVFCASLKSKKYRNKVVMGTPQSIHSAITAGHEIKDKKFDVIFIDEVHRFDYKNKNTVYSKIVDHYKAMTPDLRICGATGTPFRGIDKPIFGEGELFKDRAYSLGFSKLVKMGFLLPPVYGIHRSEDDFDYSKVKQTKTGKFDEKGLQEVVGDNTKTTKIMLEVIKETQESYGVFIFCATVEQAKHVIGMLPEHNSKLITGNMADSKRMAAMADAKAGKIKYLVNVSCLVTGVNLPRFDHIVYLRPSESLIFFIQSMGRGARLSPETNKTHFRVLDYAGNVDRFKDIDDESLAEAANVLEDEKKEAKLDIICPQCETLNSIHDRRCRGFTGDNRCEYMFTFRECPNCRHKCDVSARTCPHCDFLLHDYNKQLKLKAYQDKKTVFDVESAITVKHFNFKAKRNIVKIVYLTKCEETIPLYFDPNGTAWQQKLWKDFLVEQGMPVEYDAPTNINVILSVTCLNFKTPRVIEATKNGAYYSITNRIY